MCARIPRDTVVLLVSQSKGNTPTSKLDASLIRFLLPKDADMVLLNSSTRWGDDLLRPYPVFHDQQLCCKYQQCPTCRQYGHACIECLGSTVYSNFSEHHRCLNYSHIGPAQQTQRKCCPCRSNHMASYEVCSFNEEMRLILGKGKRNFDKSHSPYDSRKHMYSRRDGCSIFLDLSCWVSTLALAIILGDLRRANNVIYRTNPEAASRPKQRRLEDAKRCTQCWYKSMSLDSMYRLFSVSLPACLPLNRPSCPTFTDFASHHDDRLSPPNLLRSSIL